MYSQLFNLPNMLTLINLFSGCLAIYFVFGNHVQETLLCIAISLIADFFDGMAARALKIKSEIGKQLDSLADVVSFGVLPSFIFKFLIYNSLLQHTPQISQQSLTIISSAGFLFALFAALRLAKFNVDTRQTDGFIGLATPAASIFTLGLYYIYDQNSFDLWNIASHPAIIFSLLFFLCFLMIAEIPMFSFKFKHYRLKENELKFGFIFLSIFLLVILKLVALPLIIIFYILFSIFQKLKTS